MVTLCTILLIPDAPTMTDPHDKDRLIKMVGDLKIHPFYSHQLKDLVAGMVKIAAKDRVTVQSALRVIEEYTALRELQYK